MNNDFFRYLSDCVVGVLFRSAFNLLNKGNKGFNGHAAGLQIHDYILWCAIDIHN